MHWSLTRTDERQAARSIKHLGGRFCLDGPWPFRSRIMSMRLRETSVLDEHIAELGELTGLKTADLGYTKLTDRGVGFLPRYRSLQYIFLWGTRITDQSIESLIRMPWIRLVNVSATGITRAGFNRLRKSLPIALVSHQQFGVYFHDAVAPEAYGVWMDCG